MKKIISIGDPNKKKKVQQKKAEIANTVGLIEREQYAALDEHYRASANKRVAMIQARADVRKAAVKERTAVPYNSGSQLREKAVEQKRAIKKSSNAAIYDANRRYNRAAVAQVSARGELGRELKAIRKSKKNKS